MANGSAGNGYAVHAEPKPAPLDVRSGGSQALVENS